MINLLYFSIMQFSCSNLM